MAGRPLTISIVGGGPGGLYFAILMKKANPAHRIDVYERNRADDTFGFGVVFSDETLDRIRNADDRTYAAITDAFAYWGDIDVLVRGQRIRSAGHGFAGMERKQLLMLLQGRARELGVNLHFQTEAPDVAEFRHSDLIVAADGINSQIRERYKEHFKPHFDWRRNWFAWLGTTQSFPAFTFDLRENEAGVWNLGAYQYKPGHSTLVPEAAEETFRNAGLDPNDEDATVAYIERLYADILGGHKVLKNRSIWRRFPMIRNERWYFRNIVLIGDALHTAHYSIGSGTKLAMEDAITLAECMTAAGSVAEGLEQFETVRRLEVEKTQHAADTSLVWFEVPSRYWHLEPTQMAFSLLSRSKQITYENLKRRDPVFVQEVDRWFAGKVEREQGFALPKDKPPPPMFTPFRLRDMVVQNRVVVSPMGQYTAENGTPNDFHLVHLGSFAMGGAGIVFAETTHVSPESRITPGCCGIWNEEHVRAWRRITDYAHWQTGAKMCLQLGHAGRKGSTRRGWEGIDLPLKEGNWPLVAASALPFIPGTSDTPQEISVDEMMRVKAQFAASARLADQAGFDMIEIHMAHGYLLASFISPLTNKRTDGYGGSLEARMRYPLEVFDAVRAVWPEGKPMSVRISAADWAPGGNDMDDAVEIARMLKAHGCDLIDVSTGQTVHDQRPVYGRMYQVPFADAIRQDLGMATMAVGAVTSADQVNTIVAAGRADLVALARLHMLDPHFTLRAAAHYGWEPQRWPVQYGPGKDLAFRLAERANQEEMQLREAARPSTHRRAAAAE